MHYSGGWIDSHIFGNGIRLGIGNSGCPVRFEHDVWGHFANAFSAAKRYFGEKQSGQYAFVYLRWRSQYNRAGGGRSVGIWPDDCRLSRDFRRNLQCRQIMNKITRKANEKQCLHLQAFFMGEK